MAARSGADRRVDQCHRRRAHRQAHQAAAGTASATAPRSGEAGVLEQRRPADGRDHEQAEAARASERVLTAGRVPAHDAFEPDAVVAAEEGALRRLPQEAVLDQRAQRDVAGQGVEVEEARGLVQGQSQAGHLEVFASDAQQQARRQGVGDAHRDLAEAGRGREGGRRHGPFDGRSAPRRVELAGATRTARAGIGRRWRLDDGTLRERPAGMAGGRRPAAASPRARSAASARGAITRCC